jgi:hypothetical protein
MANLTAPRGFEPRRHLSGSPYNGQNTEFLIPSTDATAVFVGDIVKTGGTAGAAGVSVNGRDCEGMQVVTLATAGTTGQDIVGVVVGFLPDPLALQNKHRLASTNRIALVCTDPTVVYEVQEDGVTTPLAAADVGLNVAYTTTAGNATTGISKMCIQSTSKAVTATLPFKLLGLVPRSDNALNTAGAGSDEAKFEVMLNTGLFATNSVGA